MTAGAQLALRFPLSSRARFATFVAGPNAEAQRRVEWLAEGNGFAGLLLYGATGSGRSHLLQAACHHRAEAIYLPLADPDLAPPSLEGLDGLALVALDDVDAWLGRAETERALLALYQGLEASGGRLLVSAPVPAARLTFRYADLASRLRALPACELAGLADADKARVLKRAAEDRGLELGPAVLDFWLSRSPRDLPSLLSQLERLDEAAMAAQRRVTVPLLKEVLGL